MRTGLLIPCYIDAFFPEVGIATLKPLPATAHRGDAHCRSCHSNLPTVVSAGDPDKSMCPV